MQYANGPGISPNSLFQFIGLSPYSNFLQTGVVALTGQGISLTAGTLTIAFQGQALTATAGILTPGTTVALLTAGQWTNAAGLLGPWINASNMDTLAQDLASTWFNRPDAPSWTPLKVKFDGNQLNAAGPVVWTNFWWPVATSIGGWFYPAENITLSTGTVQAFGLPFTGSPPAFVQTPGPGRGPFTNTQFQPQPYGISFSFGQQLFGSRLTSTTGTVGVQFDTILLTGQLITSAAGTVSPVIGNLLQLIGSSITSNAGSIIQTEIDSAPLAGQLISSATGNVSFTIPPGPGGDLASTIQALIQAGLDPQVFYTCNNTVPAGNVISLTPPIGTLVPPNTAIVVLVSTGPCGTAGTSVVPNMIGLYWKAATDALEAAELSLDKYVFQISSAPQGTVIAQSIPGGTNTVPGTIVQLTLSSGAVKVIPPVPVP